MVVGVVPARGGSKGIPGKNTLLISGKPLLAYAVECGLASPSIDHTIVSTDDDKIASIGREYGADVPFMRPAELANDTAPMLPVLQHAIKEAESFYQKQVEFLILLDPTGPLREVADVEHCIELLRTGDCDAVISGNKAHRSPYFNMVTPDGDYMKLANATSSEVSRRQDSPPVYDLNTVVWAYKRHALTEEAARIPQKSKLYLVPDERALDIDTPLDLEILELVINRRQTRTQALAA